MSNPALREPSEKEIEQTMARLGFDRMQARNHIIARNMAAQWFARQRDTKRRQAENEARAQHGKYWEVKK